MFIINRSNEYSRIDVTFIIEMLFYIRFNAAFNYVRVIIYNVEFITEFDI